MNDLRKSHEALDEMVAENQRLGLYDDTAPPKRDNSSWVGLNPTEFNSIKDNATTIGYAIIKTEAMLREKNS